MYRMFGGFLGLFFRGLEKNSSEDFGQKFSINFLFAIVEGFLGEIISFCSFLKKDTKMVHDEGN